MSAGAESAWLDNWSAKFGDEPDWDPAWAPCGLLGRLGLIQSGPVIDWGAWHAMPAEARAAALGGHDVVRVPAPIRRHDQFLGGPARRRTLAPLRRVRAGRAVR